MADETSQSVNNADIFGRAVSSFPISIGTAIALEALFDPRQPRYDQVTPLVQRVLLEEYQEIYINLSTMFRNLVSASNKDAIANASIEDIVIVLDSEIDTINSLFLNEGHGLCKPVYYFTSYETFQKHKATLKWKLRTENTAQQVLYKEKHDKVIANLLKLTDEHMCYDTEIKPVKRVNALIITHYPYDLLSYKNFDRLDLLETHTGKLKKRNEWYTKYYPVGDDDLSMIPFERKLLLLFGDKVMIHPSLYKLRKIIIETANTCKWTASTTPAKVIFDLERIVKEPYVLEHIRSL